jgi:uncharacterized protein (TIGR00369 family)
MSDSLKVAEATLTAWQAREAEIRAVACDNGVSPPATVVAQTGLEFFQKMLRGELPGAPIAHSLGFLLVEVEAGRVVFQGRPQFAFYNPIGSVHGGWIATLLDSAVACAVHSLLPAGKAYTTLEIKVNYVRALTDRVPLVRAIGTSVHQGARVGTAEGRLVGPDGTLYAHASTTCLVMETR